MCARNVRERTSCASAMNVWLRFAATGFRYTHGVPSGLNVPRPTPSGWVSLSATRLVGASSSQNVACTSLAPPLMPKSRHTAAILCLPAVAGATSPRLAGAWRPHPNTPRRSSTPRRRPASGRRGRRSGAPATAPAPPSARPGSRSACSWERARCCCSSRSSTARSAITRSRTSWRSGTACGTGCSPITAIRRTSRTSRARSASSRCTRSSSGRCRTRSSCRSPTTRSCRRRSPA